MERNCTGKILVTICLLAALLAIVLPAGAVNGTISIAYRGSGGYYIGDTIIFDGYDSFSNVTFIRMTGPGLPAEGVPLNNVNGDAGTGTRVPGDTAGAWRFIWYTGSIRGIEKLQTARYYVTAFDNTYPEKTATTSILLKKPEFYVAANPGTAGYGDYVELTGTAEKGVGDVHFDIADSEGKIVHTYDTTVSSSGYFNKGFHIDMPPGMYTITMSSPTVKTTFRGYLVIEPATSPATPAISTDVPSSDPSSPAGFVTPQPAGGMGSLSVTSDPMGATVFLDSAMMGQTPFELSAVATGTHLVEIKAPGYLTFSMQVTVKPGETVTVNPTLLKNPSPVPLSVLTVIAGILISLSLVQVSLRRRQP